MSINYCTASSDDDILQILALQQKNHSSSLSAAQAARDGFVTVVHSFDLLKQMNLAVPQIIAKDNDKIIGYALVMLRSFESMIPVLVPMFKRLATVEYAGRKITDYCFYVMGQICVAENYRGIGVFDSLYALHKKNHQHDYDLCVTSVATRNTRSMRAHQRVGFDVIHTFRDQTDEWSILAWDLR